MVDVDDLLAEVEQGIGRAPGTWRVEALLKTTLEEAQKKVPATIGQLEPCDGGVLFLSSVWRPGWLALFLAEWGCPVTVLQPPELREKLRSHGADPLPSYNDMIVNAVSVALREFPRVIGSDKNGAFEH